MMEIALIIAVVVIVALGWVLTGRYSKALQRHTMRLERAKLQLAQLALGQQASAGELARLAGVASEQQTKATGLESQLAALRSELAAELNRHRSALDQSSIQTGELQAKVAELQVKFGQAVQQIRTELEVDRSVIEALGTELRQAMMTLQTGLTAAGNQLHQSVLEQLQGVEHEAAMRAARIERDLAGLGRRLTEADDSASQHLDGIRCAVQALGHDTERLGRDAGILQASARALDSRLSALRALARWQLGEQAAGKPDLVLAGGIHASQPAGVDILSVLYDEVCRALAAKIIFCGSWGPSGGGFYLSWPGHADYSPRQLLWQLLGACLDDEPLPASGQPELRSLLAGVSQTAPAAIQLGPMIAVCTPG